MVQISGESLSKRQHDLNRQVNELAAKNVNFEDVKKEAETSDMDKLFKIDLAIKYKNVDFVIEMLKSGDPLYISRVLKKAVWLYDEDHSHIINADFLHHNVIPTMSNKMKKKMLTAIFIHVNNEERAEKFYNYCNKEKMTSFALKFLINTSKSFKLNFMRTSEQDVFEQDDNYLKNFTKNSFVLFETYLELTKRGKNNNLLKFSYLYTLSNVKYLELLEKHADMNSLSTLKMGLRISKDIVTKHKDRVVANPTFYVKILKINKLLRHSTINDVKLYAIGLLPEEAAQFWELKYYKQYKPIIHAIPEEERYGFIKKIFTENYHNEEFEMSKQFYEQDYHILMTDAEREEWALRHIDSGKEIAGSGLDYTWYEFVNFNKALKELKKCIMTATDHVKRSKIINVLIKSAKTQRELEILFKYYFERHVNERRNLKEGFLRKVIAVHDVFEFDDDCWEAFNKIMYSNDVYDPAKISNPNFKVVSILYHILQNKEMPEVLINHLALEISLYSIKNYINDLDEAKKQKIYTYIYNFYLKRIQEFELGTKNSQLVTYIHFILEHMAMFKKKKNDIPEIVMNFVNADYQTYRYKQILQNEIEKKITERDLLRYLKKDLKLVCEQIPQIEDLILNSWDFRMERLLRKLKIYFSNDDIVKNFIKFFKDLLLRGDSYFRMGFMTAAYAIFQLSDQKSIIELMNNFAPENPKIDEKEDPYVLRVREMICRFARFSRPPVPLSNILMYIKGDYVKNFMPTFDMYKEDLPLPLCLKFVESLLDTPVSIQKHGLRLAFKCFTTENLRKLVLNTWNNTKNVSLRAIIYKAFFEKTLNEQDKLMFDALKKITSDLHDEDSDDVFPILTSGKLADDYEGDFLETVWVTVEKFKDNEQNVALKTRVIKSIDDRIHLIKKDTVSKIIYDYLNLLDSEYKTEDTKQKLASLSLAKLYLAAHYVVFFTKTEEDLSESIDVAKLTLDKCLKGWNKVVAEAYVYRQIFEVFLDRLTEVWFIKNTIDIDSYINSTPVFEAIINVLQAGLPLHEIYIYVWNLRITIITREAIKETRVLLKDDNTLEVIEETSVRFGRQLGCLVKEFVEKNIYFSNFTDEIMRFVSNSAFGIKFNLNNSCLKTDHVLVCIARGLLETKTVETNLLALQILPEDPQCDIDLYKSVFSEINKLSDIEVQCCLHKKYDAKRRRYE